MFPLFSLVLGKIIDYNDSFYYACLCEAIPLGNNNKPHAIPRVSLFKKLELNTFSLIILNWLTCSRPAEMATKAIIRFNFICSSDKNIYKKMRGMNNYFDLL